MPNLVSIVMPVYNGEKYIKDAINSILSQTYTDWELVIIDDGSTDKTADIIAAYKDKRIRYHFQQNQGQAGALNHGLDVMCGDYFTTLDADDCYTEESLKVRVEYLKNHPECGAVYADGYFCRENMEPVTKFSEWRIHNAIGDIYGKLISETLMLGSGTVMIRCDIIRKNRLHYDELIVWCQDIDFYIRVAELVHYGVVNQITQLYRVHNENMTLAVSYHLRLESLIRMKFKVLDSNKLITIPFEDKYEYFRKFIIENLHNQIGDQEKVINHDNFLKLPLKSQSRLLRNTAVKYIVEGQHIDIVKTYLHRSFKNNPISVKTCVLITIFLIFPNLARWILLKRNMLLPHKEPILFFKS